MRSVMGATGSGKTSFINIASGSSLRVGTGLMSCTDAVQTSKPFILEGRTVILVDTPGFDDTTKTDTEVLTMIAASLSSMYLNRVKLSGAIYMHRISDFRMGGTSTRNFNMFRELCGDTALQNVAIVTNMWSEVSLDIGEAREEQLKSRDIFFKPALGKGAQIWRHDNTSTSAQAIIHCIASKDPLALCIQRELVDERKDIAETAAGAELGRELHEQAMRYQAERRRLQDELNEALEQKDEEAREELEQATAQLNSEMMRVQIDSECMISSYSEEKERLERRLQTSKADCQQSEGENADRRRRITDGLSREEVSGSDMGRTRLIESLHRLQQQHAEALAAQRRSQPKLFVELRLRSLGFLFGLKTLVSSNFR
ncbi:hypothetical protein PC9H_010849 [Pleurotus ostreatus]|uniref:G domain-containing protein n=1 Tax=Pleurotus ostreatus TaxID=5322 RepID=A0A8H6ZQ80_PLEOS|nr:uncharacterized protein PC9H_010849 [Pleurotus ostreatus]KAF7422693.1 hypothetical protein PC9H_010849 [Pleurotus ostreatus]